MGKTLLLLPAAFAFCALATPPTATVTDFAQDSQTKLVSVSYTVDADAIVTPEFLLDGVALDPSTYADSMIGKINAEVESGTTYTFKWAPDLHGAGLDLSGKALTVRLTAWDKFTPPPYLAFDLAMPGVARYYASSNAVPGGVQDIRWKTDYLLMRRVPAKNVVWRMGSPDDELGHDGTWSQDSAHKVKLTCDYYIGVYPITQHQHELVGNNVPDNNYRLSPWYKSRPVGGISYNNARGNANGTNWPNANLDIAHGVESWSYVAKFRAVVGKLVDLPTEAQWEYACRAGTGTGLNSGKEITNNDKCPNVAEVARYAHTGGKVNGYRSDDYAGAGPTEATAVVGSYRPNRWGIYDMHGNVREWCLDRFAGETRTMSDATIVDPVGPTAATGNLSSDGKVLRITRGGGFDDNAYQMRSANRGSPSVDTGWYNLGYRLCWEIK